MWITIACCILPGSETPKCVHSASKLLLQNLSRSRGKSGWLKKKTNEDNRSSKKSYSSAALKEWCAVVFNIVLQCYYSVLRYIQSEFD